jgi:hypothetical protein
MIELLSPGLRIAGAGLVLLAILHVPISRHLRWRKEAARMSPMNEDVFHVHNFFICVVLVAMGLPCLLEPSLLLEKSRAGAWASWMLAAFWAMRLWCQWFVYRRDLWRGKRFETAMHLFFTSAWLYLTTLFALCGARQAGWLS